MLRGLSVFDLCKVRTNVKYRFVSYLEVKYWNVISDDFKVCSALVRFKKVLKGKIIYDYKNE